MDNSGMQIDVESLETFICKFYTKADERYLNLLKQHGHHIRAVKIILDQHEKVNRENACQVLEILSKTENQKVSSLTVEFNGENPLFYGGLEFIQSLKTFFNSDATNAGLLTTVDLGGLWVDLTQELLDVLSSNHPNLQTLNIQNRSLICKIHPDCLVRLVGRCTNLTHLRLFYCSLSDEVLQALSDESRKPIQHLSIKCRRQENYIKIISPESWKSLVQKSPNLKVTMIFDHDCFQEKVSAILNPVIPVYDLRLETMAPVHDSINMAANSFAGSLEHVILRTRSSRELEEALINLVTTCRKLTSLDVYCAVTDDIIEQILSLCPTLKENGKYVLKSTITVAEDGIES
ncbi:F-box/LRR-repeat protein 8 isoform X2 [Patella vulgata]|uniref:F-box/LRR-repeat protein 8 isoform X2 n=1 Tax=Patella vulgata TaxID=6465 RepID=UPI0024A8CB05|nr:F-box/LRR-repeat protein 8 isoform X2 [Patella vulgata]XP_050391196.2 F-box/LRR-repeat protein 8 isoform X2 [Patella vulgata]